MKLYEYLAKEIFSRYGIKVPEGRLVSSPEEAYDAAGKLGNVVLKAQVLTGGRGKAGGILTANHPEEAKQNAKKILSMSIKGLPVKKLLVEEYRKPEKEMYLGITIDREVASPVIMASTEGGVDIEETAKAYPERINKIHIHPLTGLHDYQARRLANSIDKEHSSQIINIIKKLYDIFVDYDCMLAEINPIAVSDNDVIALDAKMIIDDNALFRQNVEFESGNDYAENLEAKAKKYGMSYVSLDGDIGCIVNGAGLAMATLDLIKCFGGKPANFMDVKAGADAHQLREALRIVASRKLKAIVINIFGGITKCDEVANGIKDVIPEIKPPIVVRLSGTNEEEGKRLLKKYGVVWASSTEEAAKKVVELEHMHR